MGIRLLISQHLSLHHPSPGHIGTIALHARPLSIIRAAVEDASHACARELRFTPPVHISGDESATFPFLPSHLHHIVFELVKNSMRAVVERQHAIGGSDDSAPPIRIVLSSDDSEIAVRLSDEGGGIPRRDLPKVWSYLYTTTEHSAADQFAALDGADGDMERMAGNERHSTHALRAAALGVTSCELTSRDCRSVCPPGWGYGLPLSRLYARFFGGNLSVMSMPNHGLDAFLYLPNLGDTQLFLD
ncbi:hypothetical protein MMC34_008734 [Xylographa carneopallida]|nr:hypothetical protein [Xylographa carneopallida]